MSEETNIKMAERWVTFRKRYIDRTQGGAAEKLGINPGTLSLIESGKRTFTFKTINKAVHLFDLNIDWLNTGQGLPVKKVVEKETLITDLSEIKHELRLEQNALKILRSQMDKVYVELDFMRKELEELKKSLQT